MTTYRLGLLLFDFVYLNLFQLHILIHYFLLLLVCLSQEFESLVQPAVPFVERNALLLCLVEEFWCIGLMDILGVIFLDMAHFQSENREHKELLLLVFMQILFAIRIRIHELWFWIFHDRGNANLAQFQCRDGKVTLYDLNSIIG